MWRVHSTCGAVGGGGGNTRCMLEAAEGAVCLLGVVEGGRLVLLCLLEKLGVPEVIRCMLLCMLEAVEGARSVCGGVGGGGGDTLCAALYAEGYGGCALFVEVYEVIRCVLLCMLEAVEGALYLWRRWRCRR